MITKLRPMQQKLYDLMVDGHNLLIQQSRQVGITEVIKEFIIDHMITNPGKKILLLTGNLHRGNDFLDKIRKDMPIKIMGIKDNTKKQIVLQNDSSITLEYCSNSLISKLCSKSYHTVIVDNIDFSDMSLKQLKDVYQHTYPFVQFIFSCNSIKRNIITFNIVKSSLGLLENSYDDNMRLLFEKFIWYKALWYSNPDFTYDWYNEMERLLGSEQFNKEITLLK